jgi:ribosomal protein S18 acetylase RimI-like enzyme
MAKVIDYRVNPNVTNEDFNRLFASAWENYQESDFTRIHARSLCYICAYHGDELIGYVNVAWDGDIHGFILNTTVHADAQRQGIGRALVQRAAEAARERGIEWLHVDFEPHLLSFYRACGFRHTEGGLMNLKRTE